MQDRLLYNYGALTSMTVERHLLTRIYQMSRWRNNEKRSVPEAGVHLSICFM